MARDQGVGGIGRRRGPEGRDRDVLVETDGLHTIARGQADRAGAASYPRPVNRDYGLRLCCAGCGRYLYGDIRRYQRMFYELTPEAIELGFDAALPAEFTFAKREFGRGERDSPS
jgi:hypothetical protein